MKKRSDGRYQHQIFIGYDADGKRITKTFYGKTQKDCKAKVDEYLNGEQESTETLLSIAKNYLKTVDNSTLKHRVYTFTNKLGNRLISQINASEIEDILQQLAKQNESTGKPTSDRTLHRYLNAINQVFLYAEKNRMITYNPCRFVSVPKSTPPQEREALTKEEVAKIESAVHKAKPVTMLLLYSGIRRGEATALTVGDIDFNDKVININKAYDFKKKELKGPKTRNGYRKVPMPDKLVELLQPICVGRKPEEILLLNDFGERFTAATWNNYLDGIVVASGVDFTWHQLRHTYASICYEAGVDVLSYARFCGHSKKVSLEVYTHLAESKQLESADKLNAFFKTDSSQNQVKA